MLDGLFLLFEFAKYSLFEPQILNLMFPDDIQAVGRIPLQIHHLPRRIELQSQTLLAFGLFQLHRYLVHFPGSLENRLLLQLLLFAGCQVREGNVFMRFAEYLGAEEGFGGVSEGVGVFSGRELGGEVLVVGHNSRFVGVVLDDGVFPGIGPHFVGVAFHRQYILTIFTIPASHSNSYLPKQSAWLECVCFVVRTLCFVVCRVYFVLIRDNRLYKNCNETGFFAVQGRPTP